jgi:hypothetical protein
MSDCYPRDMSCKHRRKYQKSLWHSDFSAAVHSDVNSITGAHLAGESAEVAYRRTKIASNFPP